MTTSTDTSPRTEEPPVEVHDRGPLEEIPRLLADETNTSRRATLAALERALLSGQGLDQWADADLFSLLDVDAPQVAPQRTRSVVRSGSLRTAFVFSPVLMTWVGLLFAGRAYGRMVAEGGSTSGQSFLQLWLDGFGHRTFFSLDRVAGLAVLLITAAVVVSLATDRRWKADELAEREHSDRQRQRLQALAAQLTVSLSPHRSGSTVQLQKRFSEGLVQLAELVHAIADLQRRTAVAGERIQAATSASVDAARIASQAADKVTQSLAGLRAAVLSATQTQQELADMHARRQEELQARSTRELVDAVSRLRDGCVEAIQESLYERDRILAAVESVSTSAAQLSTDSRDIARDLAHTGQELRGSTGELNAAVSVHVEKMDAATRDSVTRLTHAAAQISENLGTGLRDINAATVSGLEEISLAAGSSLTEHIHRSSESTLAALSNLVDQGQRSAKAAELALDSAGRALAETAEATALRAASQAELERLAESQHATAELCARVSDGLASMSQELKELPVRLRQSERESTLELAKEVDRAGQHLRDHIDRVLVATVDGVRSAARAEVHEAVHGSARLLSDEMTGLREALEAAVRQRREPASSGESLAPGPMEPQT